MLTVANPCWYRHFCRAGARRRPTAPCDQRAGGARQEGRGRRQPGAHADRPGGYRPLGLHHGLQHRASLLDKNADVAMPPSSMTKLMTIYIVYERLKPGKLRLETRFRSASGRGTWAARRCSSQVGTQVKVEDLIRGMIVQSGNDACIVFAEGIAGSEEQFAELMNQKARELGLTNTNFRNSTGWPEPEQRMSGRDLAVLARRIIQDFPEYYHYYAEKTFKYNNIEQGNRNRWCRRARPTG